MSLNLYLKNKKYSLHFDGRRFPKTTWESEQNRVVTYRNFGSDPIFNFFLF